MQEIRVKKRSGELQTLDVEKINKLIEWATEGLTGVSLSDILVNTSISLYDGIETSTIHSLLIKSAADLISVDNPNYQYAAAKLLLFELRKSVWNDIAPPTLFSHIKNCVDKNVYHPEILEKYSEEEISLIENKIDHDRDYIFTYAGLKQCCDKYLIKDRKTNEIFETPQFMYMCIAMSNFINYSKQTRLEYVFKCYDFISKHKINLATPIMSGLRTPIKQYSSCILIDVDDNLDSIFHSSAAVGYYTAQRAGIGLNMGRLRSIGSKIRGGEVIHTGAIPFLKVFESVCKSCSQNGIRGGGATVNFPWWNKEIEDIIKLKNNAGTDENRVRKLDYCIGMSSLFYERVIKNKDISLFSTSDVPGLYEAFGLEGFNELYETYECDPEIERKTISARKLMEELAIQQLETGRIYIFNVDHGNSHSSFIDPVKMVNLCTEIVHPTKPLQDLKDEDAEIGVCTLSAINILNIKSDREFEQVCDIAVRMLDEIIENQSYPVKAAENFAKNRRSLGIGITNLAAYFAKHKVSYGDKESLELIDILMEKLQYFCIKASIELAKEFGPCKKFDRTKYSQGVLPIDTYKKDVDSLLKREYTFDWGFIRQQILEYGMRNSTLTAQMPCESSSVVQNSTNGIEPIRNLLITKKSKAGVLKQLQPHASYLRNKYDFAFERTDNIGIINILGVIQKWMDMSISSNFYYNYNNYEDKRIPLTQVIKETLYAYKMGVKSIYYVNSDDGDRQDAAEQEHSCSGGVCTI